MPTLRFTLLTFFTIIVSCTFISYSYFTYASNSKSILKLSKGYFQQVSRILIERIAVLIDRAQDLAEISSSLIYESSDFNFENKELVRYMVSVIRYTPEIYGMYFASESGSLLEVVNLAAAYQDNFIFTPDKKLPHSSAYVLREIDRTKSEIVDSWEYLDRNLNVVASESRPITEVKTTTDPRERPWFRGAMKANGEVFWSDVYNYDPLDEEGITVAKQIKSPDGRPIAAIGVDISLELFSNFLATQVIGKTGRAYILNTSGKIIIPNMDASPITEAAYKQYQNEREAEFIFKSGGVPYLGSVNIFPATTAYNWIILLAAPMSDFFGEFIKSQRQMLLMSFVILIIALLINVYFVRLISKPIIILSHETDKIRSLNFESEVEVHSFIYELDFLDKSITALRKAIRSFGRYIPKDVVKQLMEKQGDITISGEKKKIAIFFSDIEGFTSIVESHPAEKMMAQLAEYFDLLSKIIIKHKGTIDKYIGDSIMAIWGAPQDMANPEIAACEATIECRNALEVLNKKWQSEGKPLFKTRFGIASGEVIVGNIGTLERLNYTVMGDSVNVAARLQGANKIYHTQILVSERVQQAIQKAFETRLVDAVELKGKKQKINVYELLNPL